MKKIMLTITVLLFVTSTAFAESTSNPLQDLLDDFTKEEIVEFIKARKELDSRKLIGIDKTQTSAQFYDAAVDAFEEKDFLLEEKLLIAAAEIETGSTPKNNIVALSRYWLGIFYTFGINNFEQNKYKGFIALTSTFFYPLTMGYMSLDYFYNGPITQMLIQKNKQVEDIKDTACIMLDIMERSNPKYLEDIKDHYKDEEIQNWISFKYNLKEVFDYYEQCKKSFLTKIPK